MTAVHLEVHQLTVTFHDGEAATYPFTDLDELVHAYALTVHRSQGSEYPYVIVPMISAAGTMLLQRNLLYTAVTRAREGVMLIGQSGAVERAVANNRTRRRNAALNHRVTHTRGRRPGTQPPDTDRSTRLGLTPPYWAGQTGESSSMLCTNRRAGR
ncbi:ATP-binding domain-containing protein [Streptomyces himalayensis]|uniref:ATP-binding domain-containing protein n=1 Tax=Streptomyces himalayensis TaxID=2820085 RepID=UPI0035E42DCD